MPEVACQMPSPRPTRKRGAAGLALLAVLLMAALAMPPFPVRAVQGAGVESTPREWFVTDETAIPDETVLQEQLDRAVDLREREDFDRML
ncbi:MAG: hypothetical protein E4H03_13985, partial [Myxococcales bacterium]